MTGSVANADSKMTRSPAVPGAGPRGRASDVGRHGWSPRRSRWRAAPSSDSRCAWRPTSGRGAARRLCWRAQRPRSSSEPGPSRRPRPSIDRLAPHARRRVHAMADGLRQVAALPDPVGEVVEGWVRPNGLRVERVRVPLGVVGVIYENRPNVTSDAAGLCLKAGNATMLRGSSSGARVQSGHRRRCCARPLDKAGLPEDARGARGGHQPRDGGRVHAARRRDRLPDPARGPALIARCASTPRCPT